MPKLLAFAVVLSLLVIGTFVGAAALPSEQVVASYNADKRTLTGSLSFSGIEGTSAYFLLLPNLAHDPNPFVSPRVIDAEYPAGFDPAELAVDAVNLIASGERRPAAYRLLSLEPVFQTYSLEETVLAVDNIEPGDTIEIQFTTRVPRQDDGDGGLTDGIFTWRFGWFPLWIDTTDQLKEEDGVLVDTAGPFPLTFPTAELAAQLTLPDDVVLYAGADVTERVAEQTDSKTVVYSIRNNHPTRSLALVFGPDYETYTLDGAPPIRVAYLPGQEDEARLLATYARDIVADYVQRYGPYPHDSLTIVENANTRGDAFSADAIALLSDRFFTHRDLLVPGVLQRLTVFVLAHEIAHQWFGIGTTVNLDRDAWLSEGLAQYASVSYFERKYGAFDPNLLAIRGQGVLQDLVTQQFGYLNLREHLIELPYVNDVWEGFDEALVKPAADVEYENETATRVYDKGYLVARALAARVGQEAFDDALRTAVEEYRDTPLTPADLERILEDETGDSLSDWFDVWVYGDGTVDYSIRIVSRDRVDQTYETVVEVARDGGTPQDVEVEALLVSGATERLTWDGTGEGLLTFRTPSYVVRVTVDPDHRLPDSDRLNNNAPVKIVAAVKQAALPLDAYVLTPNTSEGGVSLSWLDRFRVTIGQDAASLLLREGRSEELDAAVQLTDQGLNGAVAYAYTTFSQPEVGSPGTTWESDMTLSVAGHRFATSEGPLYVLRLAAVDLPSITDSATAAIALDIASNGSARFSVAAFDELRIFPGVYLQGTGFLGFGLGDLPNRLLFTFDDLRSVTLPAAANKLSGSISIELPIMGDVPYDLFNLAMIDGQRTRLYATAGIRWTSLGQFGKTSPGIEVGIEQIFDLSTLGGLLPLTATVGVAAPLQGELKPVLYVSVSL
jgi:hypothetical protein